MNYFSGRHSSRVAYEYGTKLTGLENRNERIIACRSQFLPRWLSEYRKSSNLLGLYPSLARPLAAQLVPTAKDQQLSAGSVFPPKRAAWRDCEKIFCIYRFLLNAFTAQELLVAWPFLIGKLWSGVERKMTFQVIFFFPPHSLDLFLSLSHSRIMCKKFLAVKL